MTITHSPRPLAVALTLLTALPIPTALVQAQESEFALEEVVVTARRRVENLQDVPIAVTALNRDDLDLRGSFDIAEIAQEIPSVTLEPSRATNTTLTAFIRGVGQQDPLAGFEQGVALYLDDVYLARPQGALLDIYDVERIEVLRGPQGTLYGRNAVGGAIKYVTRRLSDEPELRLRARVGTYDQTDLIATASMPFGDTFRVGATVASLQRDGFGDNKTTGDDNYNKDLLAYRVSAEFLPSESLLIRFAYDDLEDDSNAVAGHRIAPGAVSGDPVLRDIRDTTAGASDNASTAAIGGRNELEGSGMMLSIDWFVNDTLTLRSITADREDDTESVIDFDSLAVDDFDAPVVYENDQFSQEFQLLYNSERFNVVAGFYYLDAEASNDFDVVLGQLGRAAFGAELTAYTGGVSETEAYSAFADVTYNITDRLSLAVGGRYTEDTRTADVFRASYLGVGSPAFGNDDAIFLSATSDYEAEKTFYDFSPRLNLSYLLTDDITVYAGYSQGWKAGTFDPRGANFVFDFVEEGVEPEELDSYEAGVKSTWWDGRAITNVAVFYSDYQDLQVIGSQGIDTDGDGINDDFVGTLTNAGDAEIYGLEVEGTFLITERFSIQYALSLLESDIKEYIVADVDIADDVVIQNTPDEMAFVGLNYAMELFSGDLGLNLTWSYRGDSSQFETPVRAIDQEAFSLFNASAVWTSENDHWLIGLHGKNLADEEVKTAAYCFGATGNCPTTLGLEDNTSIFYGPPRTVTATVEYRF